MLPFVWMSDEDETEQGDMDVEDSWLVSWIIGIVLLVEAVSVGMVAWSFLK